MCVCLKTADQSTVTIQVKRERRGKRSEAHPLRQPQLELIWKLSTHQERIMEWKVCRALNRRRQVDILWAHSRIRYFGTHT